MSNSTARRASSKEAAVDFGEDAVAQDATVSDADIQSISAAAQAYIDAERELTDATDALQKAQERFDEIRYKRLPDAMLNADCSAHKLANGTEITVTTARFANITEERKPEVLKWLRKKKEDALIKTTVKVDFGKGDDALAKKFIDSIKKTYKKQKFSVTEGVHPSTMKSFVKETYAGGYTLPECFGIYEQRVAVVKKPPGAN